MRGFNSVLFFPWQSEETVCNETQMIFQQPLLILYFVNVNIENGDMEQVPEENNIDLIQAIKKKLFLFLIVAVIH